MALQLTGVCPLIQVHDMPTAIAFYCDRLGFEILQHSPEIDSPEGRYFHWAWLRRDAADLMLNTAYDEGERTRLPDGARFEIHRDTGLFFGCPDVDAAYAALRTAGIDVDPPKVAPYGMKQLWLLDPDGYQLCFQASA